MTRSLQFAHGAGPIQPDLSRYPFPLLQNSIVTDTVTLVVPQQPSTNELAAAFATAASLQPDLQQRRSPARARGRSQRRAPRQQPPCADRPAVAPEPAPGCDTRRRRPRAIHSRPWMMQPGDGVTQIAVSPWSPEHAVLLLSGADDAAAFKAAQGSRRCAAGRSVPGAIALVAEIREYASRRSITDGRQSFAQLGLVPRDAARARRAPGRVPLSAAVRPIAARQRAFSGFPLRTRR